MTYGTAPYGTTPYGSDSAARRVGAAALPIRIGVGPYGSAVLPVKVSVVSFVGSAALPVRIGVGGFDTLALQVRITVGEIGLDALPIAVRVAPFGRGILPVSISVRPYGSAILPLAIGVGRFGSAGLATRVSVVAAAIADGSITVADGGSTAAVWGALVFVDGTELGDDVLGEIVIEGEENTARIAEFTLYCPGIVTLPEWTGKPVQIYIADFTSGAPVNAALLFTGVVDRPRLLMERSSIALSCTDNRQGIIAGLSRAQIDALVGGHWSPAVFAKAAASWGYANDRLSTVAASLDLSPAGELRLTPWAAKEVADLVVGEDDALEGSVLPDIAERGGLINRIDIEFGYRFPRLKAEGYAIHYDFLALALMDFGYWVGAGNKFLARDAVVSAIESAGGTVVSVDWIELPTTDQILYGTGGVVAGVWVPNESIAEDFCLGFDAVVRFDYTQQLEERHRISVGNALSIEAVGLLRDEMSGAMEGVYADPVAVEQGIFLYQSGVTNIPPLDMAAPVAGSTVAATPSLTTDSDRAAADAAMETLTAIAMTRIAASHRATTVPYSVALNPVIDSDKTVALSAQGVVAKGKVRHFKHRLNPDAGTAISEVVLAISSAAGVGIVHDDDPIAAPAGVADGVTGALGEPVITWNGLVDGDGVFTITFPGVDEAQRNTAVETIDSAFAAPLAEDLFTITL